MGGDGQTLGAGDRAMEQAQDRGAAQGGLNASEGGGETVRGQGEGDLRPTAADRNRDGVGGVGAVGGGAAGDIGRRRGVDAGYRAEGDGPALGCAVLEVVDLADRDGGGGAKRRKGQAGGGEQTGGKPLHVFLPWRPD